MSFKEYSSSNVRNVAITYNGWVYEKVFLFGNLKNYTYLCKKLSYTPFYMNVKLKVLIMKNSENQKDLVKAWTKMELNSSYGFPPVPIVPVEYDENKALQITEEVKKNLMVVQEALKKANGERVKRK